MTERPDIIDAEFEIVRGPTYVASPPPRFDEYGRRLYSEEQIARRRRLVIGAWIATPFALWAFAVVLTWFK